MTSHSPPAAIFILMSCMFVMGLTAGVIAGIASERRRLARAAHRCFSSIQSDLAKYRQDEIDRQAAIAEFGPGVFDGSGQSMN